MAFQSLQLIGRRVEGVEGVVASGQNGQSEGLKINLFVFSPSKMRIFFHGGSRGVHTPVCVGVVDGTDRYYSGGVRTVDG